MGDLSNDYVPIMEMSSKVELNLEIVQYLKQSRNWESVINR